METEELIAKLKEAMARVGPKVPDIDPGDLMLILQFVMTPFGDGKIFLLKQRYGHLVF